MTRDRLAVLMCLPNTGHQFFFVPLCFVERNLTPRWLEQQSLPSISDDSRERLVDFQAVGWRTSKSKTWMRLRAAVHQVRGPEGRLVRAVGFVLVVETNLGDRARGYVYKKEAAQKARPTPDSAEKEEFPYAAESSERLPESTVVNLITEFDLAGVLDVQDIGAIEIVWMFPGGDPVLADLIVDFGNTRTSVLVLEHVESTSQSLARICRPLLFGDDDGLFDGLDFANPDLQELLPESWFILREPPFETEGQPFQITQCTWRERRRGLLGGKVREPDEVITIVPDIFRQLSPAVIGSEAKRVLSLKDDSTLGELTFLSSPKRYAWDTDPTGSHGETFWTMQPSEWRRRRSARSLRLRGEVLRFVTRDLRVWDTETPPFASGSAYAPSTDQANPNHPRAAGLVWTALTIIETAYREINSQAWRASNRPRLRRVLDKIILTCPPGWTGGEILAYHSAWKIARNTFACSRQLDEAPEVEIILDEALASQLPFIYSEIRHLGNNAGNFIFLFGRIRNKQHSLRVMTIDIGGGTTDTSVVEYTQVGKGNQTHLLYDLLFRDSSTIAGDRLVKSIIEGVLLPMLLRLVATTDISRERFREFIADAPSSASASVEREIFTRMIFLPMVLHWLDDLVQGREREHATIQELGVPADWLDRINDALERFGVSPVRLQPEDTLLVDYGAVQRVIAAWLRPIITIHARYVAAFGCDLVVITGKPSEQPLVGQLFAKGLPMFSNRIINARGYFTGDWAPLGYRGTIRDAKLVTALGAALYRAIKSEHIANWRIERKKVNREPQRNYWGTMTANTPFFTEDDCLLDRSADQATFTVGFPTFIGRALFLKHSQPEQVYWVRWSGPPRERPEAVTLVIERVHHQAAAGEFDVSEGLRLIQASTVERGRIVKTDLVELKLCTLTAGRSYWLDSGQFDMPDSP